MSCYLAEVVEELAKKGYDYTEEFEFGLGFILDGLERLDKPSVPKEFDERRDVGL